MNQQSLFGNVHNPFEDSIHLAWLSDHRDVLLDFYQPHVRRTQGGFNWLDAEGYPLPEMGVPLFLGARMLHSFAVAQMLGREGAADVVRHGLDFYVAGEGHDKRFGGWFATVGGNEASDRKELYGQAHVLLAASSAHLAGHEQAAQLMDESLDLIDRHYWRETDGRCVEAYDRSFSELDPYRGQNANMHLTEAYLAAYEATGNGILLERATRIAAHVAGVAAENRNGAWRLPEHFDEDWQPLWDFNRDDPRHKFRPYGSQPGHWLEWSKLLMQLKGQGVDEPWLVTAARNLYSGAFADAWRPNGGFIYTVDWDGSPIVNERFFWEPPEGMGAARFLFLCTGERAYLDSYREMWEYCDKHLIDHKRGSWFPELDERNQPVSLTWLGKPDLYHAFQATLYATVPAHQGIAAWARDQAGEAPAVVDSSSYSSTTDPLETKGN